MASRNRDRRQKRRRTKKMKPAVRKGVAVFLALLVIGGLIGYRMYQNMLTRERLGTINEQLPEADTEGDDITLTDGAIKYTVFDLGGGEAILIENGEIDILIDAGTEKSAKKLCKALEKRVDGDIDYYILSSSSDKRVGGTEAIFNNFKVDTCVLGEMNDKAQAVRFASQKARNLVYGDNLTYDVGDGATLFIMKPDAASAEERGSSLIAYFTFGDTGFVALSDAGEDEIIKSFTDVHACNVIVLSSHGAEEPNLAIPVSGCDYCVATARKVDVVPTDQLAEQLSAAYYTTGELGTMEFVSDGASVHMTDEEEKVEALFEQEEQEEQEE